MTDISRVWTISLVSLVSFGAAVSSFPVEAGAAPPPAAPVARAAVRLEYSRGPGAAQCPDRETVRAEVARRLGFDPFSERGERALRCEIRADGAGLRAQIEVQDADGRAAGQRVLTSRRADCSELVPGLLLVLTVAATPPPPNGSPLTASTPSSRSTPAGGASPAPAAPEIGASPARAPAANPAAPAPPPEVPGPRVEDRSSRPRPDAARTEGARAGESAPRAPSDAAAPARPAPIDANAVRDEDAAVDALVTAATGGRPAAGVAPVPPARRPTPAPGWYLGAGVLGGLQTLPHPSWGADVTVGAGTPRFSIALDGRFHAPSTLRVAAGTVTLWTAAAWVVPCARRGVVAACALLGAGVLRGTGTEVADARTATSPWLAAGVRAELRLPLSRATALTLRLDGYAVPLQTVVQLGDPPGEVWRTPRVAAALALGFVHHFRRGP